jgi:DNA-binding NarL/FixJ family response regulator
MTEGKKVLTTSLRGRPQREKSLTSDREKEIVQLVVQGYRDCDIAERLFINELTVKQDLQSIFCKLGVSNRLELALYTIQHRLMDKSNPPLSGERGTGFSFGCRVRNAWVDLRRRLPKI